MMNKRWIQRTLALILALTLVLSAGIAEELAEAGLFEAAVGAEQVDPSVDADELELDDGTDDEDDWVPVPTITPEPLPTELSVAEDEDAQEPVEPSDAEPAQEPESADPVAETPTADTAEDAPIADAEPKADTEPAAETEPTAEDVTEATAAPDAEGVADEAVDPAATEVPAATAVSQPTEAPAAELDLDAALIQAEADTAAKPMLAAAAFAFPAAKLTLGKGEWIDWAVQLPAGIDAAQVSYTSSKPSVVKVAAPGVLHAVKKGSATITATAPGGQKASCAVTVKKAPSKIKLTPKKVIFGLGETRTLKVKLTKGSASGVITWSSSKPGVCTVDAAGNLTGVGVGTAKITARTFNGKRATRTVTVLAGRTPTTLSFASNTLYLGLKEKQWLSPQLGAGEAAKFTFSSNRKSIATVSPGGLVTAKRKGTAKITVKTHNGLKFKLTVKVIKAPTQITLSKTKLTLETGQVETLGVTLPSGTASAVTWSSSKTTVATVDAAGNVFGISPGTAKITAKAFNGKSASCTVTVTLPPTAQELADRTPPSLTNAQMAANLRAGSLGGSKRDALGNIAELLMNAGYEPTFAAGVVANVYSEGTYGLFESSKYVSNYLKRPKYFCYLDGGDYYVNGVLTTVFLSPEEINSYTGPLDKSKLARRFGEEKYYWNKWSGKYVWNINLLELKAFMDLLTASSYADGTPDGTNKGWNLGKFGLGVTQWTGGRTRKLLAKYLKYSGNGPTITKAQVIAAENEQIIEDLGGDYKSVYTGWRKENVNALYGEKAAYSAGSWVCLKYEIPANKETSAVKRGNNAIKFYKIMLGLA